LLCVLAVLAAVLCGALLGAAVLVPAPPAVLPLVVVVCIGAPMVAGHRAYGAMGVLRRRRAALDEAALGRLRRELDRIPETQHPLGL
jgi:hypothetical protein